MFKRIFACFIFSSLCFSAAAAQDDGISVDLKQYENRVLGEDFTGQPCPNMERSLVHVKGNLYRHTADKLPSLHSGFVLITKEGALVIDPAFTCTSTWLNNEIKTKFNVKVKYVVYTHAHADHISGGQIFEKDGAIIVANQRAVEPIVGEKVPTALPSRVFDEKMTIQLGGETVHLHRIAPSHSNSMILAHFPGYKAIQCTDVCQSKTMPYNDFLDFYYDGWIKTLDWVIDQDVEIIDVGHYSFAKKEDIVAERRYMVDLHQQVLNLAREGKSWDELYRKVQFSDEVKGWFGFESMKTLNIMGMYRWVSNHRRGLW